MRELLDFDVFIEFDSDGYRVHVVASPAGQAHNRFDLPFTDKDLKILVLEVIGSIGRARRKVRRIESPERRLLEDFGSQLFNAVFAGPVRRCLDESRLMAESRNAGLRIRLRLPEVLADFPWEYLYDNNLGFLSLSPETALVRYMEGSAPVRAFPISPPLRVLAIISAPVDVPELQADEEWEKLNDALSDMVRRGMVQVNRVEGGTLGALQRPLRRSEYHVLHFIGHGVYNENAHDGALAFEGAQGKTRLVTGRDLGMMIRGHRSLRLVTLNACEGARTARDDPMGGVAQALVRQGIPAVIAMQFEISDTAALVFSQSFYQAIADGFPVDISMVEARRTMFAEGHEVEWATPVLYLRSPDGQVFATSRILETSHPADRQTDCHDSGWVPKTTETPPVPQTQFYVDTLPNRSAVRAADLPLVIEGRHSGDMGAAMRVILEASYQQYYVQNPEIRFLPDGTWCATNILPGDSIMYVHFVMLDDAGKRFFDQMVERRSFGAFREMPANSQVLRTVRIYRI